MSGERRNEEGFVRQLNTSSIARGREALLLEGVQSGEPIPVNREFWQGLRAEARKLVEVEVDKEKVRNKK
jgi:hypothetical protein